MLRNNALATEIARSAITELVELVDCGEDDDEVVRAILVEMFADFALLLPTEKLRNEFHEKEGYRPEQAADVIGRVGYVSGWPGTYRSSVSCIPIGGGVPPGTQLLLTNIARWIRLSLRRFGTGWRWRRGNCLTSRPSL